MLFIFYAFNIFLKVGNTLRSNRVSDNKNCIFIRLPKRSVAYSATIVKKNFVDFLKFL